MAEHHQRLWMGRLWLRLKGVQDPSDEEVAVLLRGMRKGLLMSVAVFVIFLGLGTWLVARTRTLAVLPPLGLLLLVVQGIALKLLSTRDPK